MDSAARLLRRRGLRGAGVVEIMADAGLTHGGFYLHFPSKDALLGDALRQAASSSRERYFGRLRRERGAGWLRGAVRAYLAPRHRDAVDEGCPYAAWLGDLAREHPALRQQLDRELLESAAGFAEHLALAGEARPDERALATLALCAGGLSMARAVKDPRLSSRILRACRELALTGLDESTTEDQ